MLGAMTAPIGFGWASGRQVAELQARVALDNASRGAFSQLQDRMKSDLISDRVVGFDGV